MKEEREEGLFEKERKRERERERERERSCGFFVGLAALIAIGREKTHTDI